MPLRDLGNGLAITQRLATFALNAGEWFRRGLLLMLFRLQKRCKGNQRLIMRA